MEGAAAEARPAHTSHPREEWRRRQPLATLPCRITFNKGMLCHGQVSTEELVPLMAYALLRAAVPALAAELAFTAAFMPPAMAKGKEGYALTTVQAAARPTRRPA